MICVTDFVDQLNGCATWFHSELVDLSLERCLRREISDAKPFPLENRKPLLLGGNDIATTYTGMMIAIPEPEWGVFSTMSTPEPAETTTQKGACVDSQIAQKPQGQGKCALKSLDIRAHARVLACSRCQVRKSYAL